MMDPQKKEEILTKREQFAERFLEYPIIYFVVRSWLMSWVARIGMTLGVLMVMGLILGMPRIWRVSPPDVTPVIKISGLDELKAMVLERNAKRYLAQGRQDYGIMAYHASVVHNLGNLRRLRRFLDLAVQRQLEKGGVEMDTVNLSALRQANWLKRISKEPQDLERVARLYDALEFDDETLLFLGPQAEALTEPLQKMLIKALLRQGYVEQFEVYWKKWDAAGRWGKDDELKLYRAAATAGFGAPDQAAIAKQYLRERLEEGPQKVTANRLFELLSYERRETEDYLACLKRLEDWRQDRLPDHSRAWLLLAATGRKAEALTMADQFNRAPRTALETSLLAAAYYELGMVEDAQKLLDQFIERFGFFERLWVQQSTILAASQKWTDLRNLIAKMRLDPNIAHRMMGFSYYLEGRSELGEGRPAAAYELFQRISQYGIPNLEVAFVVIDQMRKFGHLDVAAKLVEQIEEKAKDYPRYWMFVVQLGGELKNEDLLLKAAEQYLRLRPDEAAAKNNFAAALLASRQRGTEAAKLTFELLSAAPNLPELQVNHAEALALSRRSVEAEELLKNVELNRLGDLEKTMYYFALTDSLVGQQKMAQAEAAASKIEERFLYSRQLDELKGWREKFAEATQAKPAAPAGSK